MLTLLPAKQMTRLLSLASGKKAAFMLLLYQRMVPELRSFAAAHGRDFSCFQEASERFWSSMIEISVHPWLDLRERLLNELPDSEQFGSHEAYFALNCGLVAAELAGFLADRQDNHIVDAIGYARDSLDAHATRERRAFIYDEQVENEVEADPLVKRERRTEEEDVALLATLPDPPWATNILSMLQARAAAQSSLLSAP
jgi:uncharacterized protein YjaG (DUF416 family)